MPREKRGVIVRFTIETGGGELLVFSGQLSVRGDSETDD